MGEVGALDKAATPAARAAGRRGEDRLVMPQIKSTYESNILPGKGSANYGLYVGQVSPRTVHTMSRCPHTTFLNG